MIVKYAPEGGAVQSWTYAPQKVRQSAAEMVEKKFGGDWDEFNKKVLAGNAKARRVLLWHCLRTDHPVYRWEDTPDFAMAEVTVEFEPHELATIRGEIVKSKDIDEDVRASALSALDDIEAAELPKVDSKDDDSTIGAP